MSWMQFTIDLLDKLAWPMVVIFIILALRKPISALAPLAKKLKFKDFEVEFGQDLKAVSKKAEGAFPELKQDRKSVLIASVENLPNSAVLEAWRAVDEAAEALITLKRSDIDLNVDFRYKLIEDILVKEHFIDTKKGKVFSELRQLRNKVAHAAGFQVGKAEAIQYIELCFRLVEHLNTLTN